MSEMVKFFITGIALGNGPCLVTCLPLVLPYIVVLPKSDSEPKPWKLGLKLSLLFSFSRLVAHSILAFLAVAFYQFVFGVLGGQGEYLKILLGLIVLFYGLFFLLGLNKRVQSHHVCASMLKGAAGDSKISMTLFGLLVGFSPCGSLLSVLTYISATAQSPLHGLLAGFSFSLGTIFTPLIPLGVLAGCMVNVMQKFSPFLKITQAVSALILIYFGATVTMQGIYFI